MIELDRAPLARRTRSRADPACACGWPGSAIAPAIEDAAATPADSTRSQLELARLVRFDPRHRLVICATALIDARETIVGVGAIGLGPRRAPEPDLLWSTTSSPKVSSELLHEALVGRARPLPLAPPDAGG